MQSESSDFSLELVILDAKLTRDTETFGKMDPFVQVTY